MKTKNIFSAKKLLLLILVGMIGFSGCKKFLDINENPNNPDSADPTLLLPTSEAAIGQVVGNSFQVYGGIWSQYWTQNPTSSQYRTLDQYNLANSDFDRPWLTLYRSALINSDLIIKNNTVTNYEDIKGIAYILKAYAFQLATDAFGDIPLSEALQGKDFGSPKYESQELVYDSIFKYIDMGTGLIGSNPNAITPGNQDIVFQGDMNQWKAFANTLKLRAYLRLSNVDPTKAQTGIASLYSSNAVFLSEDAKINYSTTGGNENPLYNEMVSPVLGKVQNLVASATVVKAFLRNNDPRLNKFYDLVPEQDTIAYIQQGGYISTTTKLVSPPSALVGGKATNPVSATAPVKLISSSESYFLQAEAVARGWAPTGDATALFRAGISASFVATGLTETDAADYIANAEDAVLPGSVEGKIKAIITQKYYAMCGFQGFEAWTEWRRTGYPDFFVVSVASKLGANKMPLRLLYSDSELQSNLNYPGTIPLDQPVWWDK